MLLLWCLMYESPPLICVRAVNISLQDQEKDCGSLYHYFKMPASIDVAMITQRWLSLQCDMQPPSRTSLLLVHGCSRCCKHEMERSRIWKQMIVLQGEWLRFHMISVRNRNVSYSILYVMLGFMLSVVSMSVCRLIWNSACQCLIW